MKMEQKKYVWDITIEKNFTDKEMENVNMVSKIISRGGNVRELQKAIKQIDVFVK